MRSPCLVLIGVITLITAFGYSGVAQTQNCVPPVPVPSASAPNIFSDEQEVYLGDAVAEYIQRNYHVIEDPEVTAYLTAIGARLTKNLPPNRLRFQFFLVDLADANAFVLPGGRIYVSRKLIAAAQTEDELASVIAHELGHLVVHQGAVDTTRLFKEVLGITAVGDRHDIFEKYHQLIDNVATKPRVFKTEDREKGQLTADQAGLYALAAAGYDVNAMARFWNRVTETQGKKGNWFSDLFGTTKPEQRRLREMAKMADDLPAACKTTALVASDSFRKWQSQVVSYTGLGRNEALHGVLVKRQLLSPLRSDIIHLRFSPDGNYILAQDDSGINVLTRDPFAVLFRIETPYDTFYADFSPDSQTIVFHTTNLRVERWSVANQNRIDAKELVVHGGCLQTQLSPDGNLLACLSPEFELRLITVASNEVVWRKKDFYSVDFSRYIALVAGLLMAKANTSDLNLGLIHMRFSPDGKFFVAGCDSPLEYQRTNNGNMVAVLDVATLTNVSIPDLVKKLVVGGFTFVGNDRLAGINRENVKKSAVVKFPTGEILSELELWRPGMTAATRGDYLLIRPIKDYALGVLDINQKKFTKVNQRAALDIFDQFLVSEMRNGEIGLYRMEKNELVATAELSNITLGRLQVAEVSEDFKWLALSGRSRGGVWKLESGEPILSLRGFQGGYVSADGFLFADFPKYEEAERNIAKLSLLNGEITPGPKIDEPVVHQFGQYMFVARSGKPSGKERSDIEFVNKPKTTDEFDYRKNVTIEFLDARTMKSLWSKNYPKEPPRVWVAPNHGTVAMVWNTTDETAKSLIKNDSRLTQQLSKLNEKEGDYFVQVLNAQTGDVLGSLLIETGKGSFRLLNVFAVGEWVLIRDSQNRILVYSLKTGEQRAKFFGSYATISPRDNLLCVENEIGKLAIYDLTTQEKLDELIFSSPISMARFTPDGKRLFVLTVNQFTYLIDISTARSRASKQ